MIPTVEAAPWDSDCFGYKVGKLTLPSRFEGDRESLLANQDGYRLIYVFSEIPLQPTISKCRPMPAKVTLHQYLPKNTATFASRVPVVPFDVEKDDYRQLEQLALLSGTFSRFNTDAGFSGGEYEKLYRQWLRSSVFEGLAFEVLVTKDNNKLTGFITLEQKNDTTAAIGLTAVDLPERGRGLGTALVQEARKKALKRGCSEWQVSTQADNRAALHLYEKTGFKPLHFQYIYHYWNP